MFKRGLSIILMCLFVLSSLIFPKTENKVSAKENLYNIRWVSMAIGGNDGSATEDYSLEHNAIQINRVIWDGEKFIAVGDEVLFSKDGINWDQKTKGYELGLRDVIWNGNMYIAIGSTSEERILTSKDAINWTPVKTEYTPEMNRIAWNGKKYVLAGHYKMLVSDDGLKWTNPHPGDDIETAEIYDVACNENLFVVIGQWGKIFTSSDGVAWNTNKYGKNLKEIIWAGNRFVAVGSNGCIVVSSDGLKWEEVKSGVTSNIYSIAWDGSNYVATTDSAVLISTDGVNWTKKDAGKDLKVDKLIWNGKVFVGLGGSSLIYTGKKVVGIEASKTNIKLPAYSQTTVGIYELFNDGTKADITKKVNWKSDNEDISAGFYEHVLSFSGGTATISAELDGMVENIKVDVAPVSKIEMAPKSVTVNKGQSFTPKLTAVCTDGQKVDVTEWAKWKSDNTKVATVDFGEIKGANVGSTTVTAELDGQKADIKVTVEKVQWVFESYDSKGHRELERKYVNGIKTKETRYISRTAVKDKNVGKTFWVRSYHFGDDKALYDLSNKKYSSGTGLGFFVKVKIEDCISEEKVKKYVITLNNKKYKIMDYSIQYANKNNYEIFEKDPKTVFKWNKSIWTKIENGEYWLGMTTDMAILSLSLPSHTNKYSSSWGTLDQWVYADSNGIGYLYLHFYGKKLKSFVQY